MKLMHTSKSQAGAVSLFIIVFTALLITIVTVSFVRLMLSDQQQATTSDLSQSAYDSAQAGIEDAKRALLFYQSECATGDVSRCATAQNYLNSDTCNDAVNGVYAADVSGQEVLVKQTQGDESLQQAYTCVKVTLQTDDYIGSLNQDASKLIPLIGVSVFNTIKIEWFSAKDLQSNTTTVDVPSFARGPQLLTQAAWSAAGTPNRPSIMRAQLMQFSTSGFMLSDFDGDTNSAGVSDANTLFLYPSNIVDTTKSFASNARKTATSSPVLSTCSATLGSGGYACSATITLPDPIGGGSRQAYLNLAAIYKKANYRITLLNGSTPVQFNGVQPKIDSTGRANDLFRRVESRVEVLDGIYPDAAVDITGSFCKDFLITDNVADYSANASCAP